MRRENFVEGMRSYIMLSICPYMCPYIYLCIKIGSYVNMKYYWKTYGREMYSCRTIVFRQCETVVYDFFFFVVSHVFFLNLEIHVGGENRISRDNGK